MRTSPATQPPPHLNSHLLKTAPPSSQSPPLFTQTPYYNKPNWASSSNSNIIDHNYNKAKSMVGAFYASGGSAIFPKPTYPPQDIRVDSMIKRQEDLNRKINEEAFETADLLEKIRFNLRSELNKKDFYNEYDLNKKLIKEGFNYYKNMEDRLNFTDIDKRPDQSALYPVHYHSKLLEDLEKRTMGYQPSDYVSSYKMNGFPQSYKADYQKAEVMIFKPVERLSEIEFGGKDNQILNFEKIWAEQPVENLTSFPNKKKEGIKINSQTIYVSEMDKKDSEEEVEKSNSEKEKNSSKGILVVQSIRFKEKITPLQIVTKNYSKKMKKEKKEKKKKKEKVLEDNSSEESSADLESVEQTRFKIEDKKKKNKPQLGNVEQIHIELNLKKKENKKNNLELIENIRVDVQKNFNDKVKEHSKEIKKKLKLKKSKPVFYPHEEIGSITNKRFSLDKILNRTDLEQTYADNKSNFEVLKYQILKELNQTEADFQKDLEVKKKKEPKIFGKEYRSAFYKFGDTEPFIGPRPEPEIYSAEDLVKIEYNGLSKASSDQGEYDNISTWTDFTNETINSNNHQELLSRIKQVSKN